MFGLFRRKSRRFSIDFESIGVDIHSHLIPGVDDGAKNLEDSIALIKGLKNLGFEKIITKQGPEPDVDIVASATCLLAPENK